MSRLRNSLLTIALSSALTACSSNTAPAPTAEPASPQPAETAETSPTPEPVSEVNVDEVLAKMSLEEKVGQMIMPAFRTWKAVAEESDEQIGKTAENSEQEPAVNVTELNDEIRECIRNGHFGSVILFAENFRNAEQTLRLTADMQKCNQEGGGIGMMIAADQEGGNVSRITYGTTGVSNMALGAARSLDDVKDMARIFGNELSVLGVNTNLAPDLDINNNPNNPVIGIRSFSDSPEIVAECGAAFMKGLQETGTISTMKHFPGHGNTDTDSHTGFPLIQSTYEELKKFELVPFQKAIDEGADMIMTAHIQYPAIENETYISTSTGEEVFLPATMSDDILTGILKKDMGFNGIVVTDALNMDAIEKNFEYKDALRMSVNAGADILMLPHVLDSKSLQVTNDTVAMMIQMVKDGEISEERVDDAVRRILTVKKKYGLLEEKDWTVTDEQVKKAEEIVGSDENRDKTWEIAEHAITVVKNEDAFPLTVKPDETILVLLSDTAASRAGVGEVFKEKAEEYKLLPENAKIETMVHSPEKDINTDECREAAKAADHVILINRTWNSTCIDPSTANGLSIPLFEEIISERQKDGKKTIFISNQLPYDAARFTDADAIILSYFGSAMSTVPPKKGEGSGWSPNLAAALCQCLGKSTPAGKLPVNIYALDSNSKITDQVLYPRAE